MSNIINHILTLPKKSRIELIDYLLADIKKNQDDVHINKLLLPDFFNTPFSIKEVELPILTRDHEISKDQIIFSFNLAISIFLADKQSIIKNYFKDDAYVTCFHARHDMAPPTLFQQSERIILSREPYNHIKSNVGISDHTICLKKNGLDLCLILKKGSNHYKAILMFNNGCYADETIRSLCFVFEKILDSFHKRTTNETLQQMSLLSNEHQKNITAWSAGKKTNTQAKTVLDQIFAVFTARKTKIALDFSHEKTISYEQLYMNVIRFVSCLKNNGITKGDVVCVYLQKSPELYALILSIMVIGAIYTPVDSTHPYERLGYIAEDSDAKCIVTDLDKIKIAHLQTPILSIEQFQNEHSVSEIVLEEIKPDMIAYIIYTSGTTGHPKGVLVPHRALLNFTDAICSSFAINNNDRFLQFASLSFDVSIFEIFSTFYMGGTLCIIDDEAKKEPKRLDKFIQQVRVTIAELPPVMLPLLNVDCYDSLRLLSVGGEKFPMALLHPWNNGKRRIVNGYGPTEATVMVSTFDCAGKIEHTPPIGKPLNNVTLFILNEAQQLSPLGALGELYISGENLAKGYINKNELTREKFCTLSFLNKKKVKAYRTGDLVRWRHDGNIEILGRTDRQVKINGYRIELSEIEKQLLSYEHIEQAAVVAIQSGEHSHLVAFFSTQNYIKINPEQIKQSLKKTMPLFMIPDQLVQYHTLPLNHSGKVDSKTLEKIFLTEHIHNVQNIFTQSKYATLLSIVNETIPGYGPDIDRDFFVSGANSLSIARLLVKVDQEFTCKLDLPSIYSHSSVKQLNQLIEEVSGIGKSSKVDIKTLFEYLKDPWVLDFTPTKQGNINVIYCHCAGGSAYSVKSWTESLDDNLNLYSIQLPGHDQRLVEPPLHSVTLMAERLKHEFHDILNKPVILIGHSFGALLAYELAKQLELTGQFIHTLVVVASRPAHILPANPFCDEKNDAIFIQKLQEFGGLTDELINNTELLNKLLPSIKADAIASEEYIDFPNQQLSCPIYVYFGEKDRFVDAQIANEWSLYTKNAFTIQKFQGGHFLQVEQKELFINEINTLAKNLNFKKEIL